MNKITSELQAPQQGLLVIYNRVREAIIRTRPFDGSTFAEAIYGKVIVGTKVEANSDLFFRITLQ